MLNHFHSTEVAAFVEETLFLLAVHVSAYPCSKIKKFPENVINIIYVEIYWWYQVYMTIPSQNLSS